MSRSRSNWSRETRRIEFTPAQKRFILRRDRSVCCKCGGHADQADHVIPIAEGGANDVENGAAICDACHLIKSREEAQRGYARRQARLHLPPEPRPFDHFEP